MKRDRKGLLKCVTVNILLEKRNIMYISYFTDVKMHFPTLLISKFMLIVH